VGLQRKMRVFMVSMVLCVRCLALLRRGVVRSSSPKVMASRLICSHDFHSFRSLADAASCSDRPSPVKLARLSRQEANPSSSAGVTGVEEGVEKGGELESALVVGVGVNGGGLMEVEACDVGCAGASGCV
jgi:hypothetical protein